MKLTLSAAILIGGLVIPAAYARTGSTQAELQKEAKISKAHATKIALAKVPGGKLASEELEREHGKLIYSFDIKTKSPGVTEVNVDAMNGHIVAVHHETPASEAVEKKNEAKEKH